MFRETKELPVTEARLISPYHHIAEMIRVGCKIYPNQAFGHVMATNKAACAIGAAHVGAMSTLRGGYLLQAFLVSSDQRQCPLCPESHTVGGTVVHLNDDHRMSREWIADDLDRYI